MALQLIDPRDKYVMKHTALPVAVIGHIRDVLKAFLMKPEYTKFYVGITQDVSRRLQEHQRTKPEYKLMIPVYDETGVPGWTASTSWSSSPSERSVRRTAPRSHTRSPRPVASWSSTTGARMPRHRTPCTCCSASDDSPACPAAGESPDRVAGRITLGSLAHIARARVPSIRCAASDRPNA